MIKKTIAPLLLLGGLLCQAQVSTVEFALNKNQKVANNYITDDGYSSFVIFDRNAKADNLEICTYDKNLELIYKRKFDTEFMDNSQFFGAGKIRPIKFYSSLMAESGECFYSNEDKILLDKNGNSIDYGFKIDTRRPFDLEGSNSQFITLNQFVTKENTCWFGVKVVDKDKKTKERGYYFIRKSNSNESDRDFQFPINVYTGEENRTNLRLAGFNDEVFYTVSKDLNKGRTENTYHLVGINYDGIKVLETTVPVSLDGKFFMASNNGGGDMRVNSSYSFHHDMSTTTHMLNHESTGNIYLDFDNQAFYIYGLYTDYKDDDFYNARFGGFYVYKYDFDGESIWKLQEAIDDKNDFNKAAVAAFMEMEFYEEINGSIGISVSKWNTMKFSHMFVIDTKDGHIVKSDKIDFKVDKAFHQGYKKGVKKDNALVAGISMKDNYGDNLLDFETIFAAYVNTGLKDYLQTKKDEELRFNSRITSEGIYLIEENLEDKIYKLMKFEWEQAF
ncbi:hypothetical protein [Mangrovimonas sp. TPBH4]|uniref:hypothetical protein n=1 Tax=Mangrovimonas sp. TPBH4 TaxID=1645914 RepID=UPI0006B68608|nr:hypothetical protein [Mangrovimonas sp. TPBH4]